MIRLHGKNYLSKAGRKALLYAALLLPLAACGSDGGDPAAQNAPPPPMAGETIKPLVIPGSATTDLGPVRPAGSAEASGTLAPPGGLNIKPLFAEPLKSNDARMARLEKAVQDLRNDFDTMTPAVVRMTAMESNLRDLVSQMKTANDAAQAVPPPAAMPTAAPVAAPDKTDDKKADEKPAAEKPAAKEAAPAKAPAAAPGAASVKALRLGDHGDTTRIVLELSAKAAATAALDGDGKGLEVDLAQVNWTGKDSGGMKGGKLVSTWKYADGKLHIDLLHPASIKSQKLLPPSAGNKDFRLVIDLAAAESPAPAKSDASPAPAPADTAKPAGGK